MYCIQRYKITVNDNDGNHPMSNIDLARSNNVTRCSQCYHHRLLIQIITSKRDYQDLARILKLKLSLVNEYYLTSTIYICNILNFYGKNEFALLKQSRPRIYTSS